MKRLLLYILLGVIALPIPLMGRSTPVSKTIYINNKKIEFESPILNDEGTLYMPLRPISDALHANLTYSRKNDAFILETNENPKWIIILPLSRESWFNANQFFFAEPARYFNNQIHVPLLEFFSFLGYKINSTDSRIDITVNNNPSKKEESTNSDIIASTGIQLQGSFDRSQLPYFEKSRHLFLSIGDVLVDIQDQFEYDKSILYVNMIPALTQYGFSITQNEGKVTLAIQDMKWVFSLTEKEVQVKTNTQEYTGYLAGLIKEKNGKLLFPLQSITSLLNLDLHWDPEERIINLLYRIHKMDILKSENGIKIKVFAGQPIQAQTPEILPMDRGYTISFLNTFSGLNDKKLQVSDYGIYSLKLKNNSEDLTAILTIRSNETFLPMPYVTSTPYGADITFHNAITQIDQKFESDRFFITIKGKQPFKPYTWYTDTKDRFVIDIPYSISQLPLVIPDQQSGLIRRIRTSQYQVSPPKTRVVLELLPGAKIETTYQKESDFVIRMKRSTVRPAEISAPSEVRSLLSTKVIVIDAGHGGRDPGAIGQDKEYEKKYTLEIAKKVENYLKKDGAEVIMTRTRDTYVSLQSRSDLANQNKADIFVSIHVNHFPTHGVGGSESYYYKFKDKSLAYTIQKNVALSIKTPNRGIKRSHLYVLANTEMPAALVEPAFISNPDEVKLLESNEFQEQLAKGIYDGIKTYFTEENK